MVPQRMPDGSLNPRGLSWIAHEDWERVLCPQCGRDWQHRARGWHELVAAAPPGGRVTLR